MSNQVYYKKQFKVYKTGINDFIIHNSRKEFYTSHTHVSNYNTCKQLINAAIYKNIPKWFSNYLLNSLMRISDDIRYIEKIKIELEFRNKQKKSYSK